MEKQNKETDVVAAYPERRVPDRLKTIIVVIVLAHFAVVSFCLMASYRLSNFAIEILGYLSPYAVSTNLRMDLQPTAITNPAQLESPLIVKFSTKGESEWKQWPRDSKAGDKAGVNRLRQRRYLGQISALLDMKNDDGVTRIVSAMLNDIESKSKGVHYDRFRIATLPAIAQEEWELAQQYRNQGDVPEGLKPEIVMSASIVRLEDGSIGILPETDEFRTVPVVQANEAAAP